MKGESCSTTNINMEKEEFFIKMKKYFNIINIDLSEKQNEKFYEYMNLLIEWNEKINLTAITNPEEIILKHFIDSATILKYIKEDKKIVDIGTGAGFPGVPIKILNEELEITLVDSLNKRINFLNEVINKTSLKNIEAVHMRAEDFGINKKYREKYNYATSRAVAKLSVLVEYMLPLLQLGGKCICMKGNDIEEELEESKNAIKILGGNVIKVDKFKLPNSDINRNIVIIEKVKDTPSKYPRKAGMASKNPL